MRILIGQDWPAYAQVLIDDAPGSLLSTLGVFSKHNVNITRIDSRPDVHSFHTYAFHLDFEGVPGTHSRVNCVPEHASAEQRS